MSNIYDKMLEVMQKRGRCQYLLENGKGQVCLLGAKDVVMGYDMKDPDQESLWEVDEIPELVEVIKQLSPGHDSFAGAYPDDSERVYRFNDRAETDEEVFDALRAASALFEIRHASEIKIEELADA